MRIRIITISHKVEAWLEQGFKEYVKRLQPTCQLELIQLPPEKRHANVCLKKTQQGEAEKINKVLKSQNLSIALDSQGLQLTTEQFTEKLKSWRDQGHHVDFIIGGPDGLAEDVKKKATMVCSLSLLTFPHTLVRLLLAEQIYRAISILQNHPYHR